MSPVFVEHICRSGALAAIFARLRSPRHRAGGGPPTTVQMLHPVAGVALGRVIVSDE
jgi:hypothetical protein